MLAMYTLFHKRELISVLSDEERTIADLFLREIRNGEEKTGLILKTTDNVCLFVHQTYAEYFCALLIFEKYATLEFESMSFNRFINIFLLQVLRKNESYTIVKFMKSIIKTRHNEIKFRYSKCKILLEILLGDFDVLKQNNFLCSFFMYMIEHSIDENNGNVQLKDVILQARECNKPDVLNVACKLGCIKLVKLIIELSDLSMIRHNCFPLHQAAGYGHADIVAFLLENKYEVDGLAPQSSILNEIIDMWGSVNDKIPRYKGTPLQVAASMGHTKVVELLLANDANINPKSINGCTPLFIAVVSGLTNPIKIFAENGVKFCDLEEVTPLNSASRFGNVKIIELLLKHGADVNVFDTTFELSPLMFACYYGNIKVVKALLENGACANSSAKESGETALFFAVKNGHYEIADLLLANGALVNIILQNGIASRIGYMNAADCNIYTEKHKVTALQIAIKEGRVDIARLLIEYGAQVNADYTKNIHYITLPLHVAAAIGNREMVEMLLNKGANINSCEKNNLRPIHVASNHGHASVVHLLLKKGARVGGTDKHNFATPLFFAAFRFHWNVVNVLIKNGVKIRFHSHIPNGCM
uniref:Ankyrin-2 n=1 Tax=Culex pipiens TaxID=7175 RepID=A0A8D8AKH4_CULPI